jgi:hypothetical protein
MLLGRVITDDILEEMLYQHEASFLIPAASMIEDTVYSGLNGLSYEFRDSLTRDLPGFDNAMKMRNETTASNIKFSTIFGLQILADIHVILGPDVGKPTKRMRISLNMTKTYLQSYGRWVNSDAIAPRFKQDTWDANSEWALRGATLLFHGILTNSSAELKAIANSMHSAIHAPRLQTPDPPFSQDPVLSGLAMLGTTLFDNYAASCTVDKWWAVMPTAHLYNALLVCGYIDWEWKSMEDIIRLYTPEYIFNGGRPTEQNDCFVKIRLAKGLGADLTTRPTDRDNKVQIKRKPRKLEPKAPPFIQALRQWMLPQDNIAGAEGFQSERLLIPF